MGHLGLVGVFKQHILAVSCKRTSARVKFGTRFSAQILKIFINFGTRKLRTVISLYGAEINSSTKLDAEFNIWSPSPQVGVEVTPVPKLLMPNIDCPKTNCT